MRIIKISVDISDDNTNIRSFTFDSQTGLTTQHGKAFRGEQALCSVIFDRVMNFVRQQNQVTDRVSRKERNETHGSESH